MVKISSDITFMVSTLLNQDFISFLWLGTKYNPCLLVLATKLDTFIIDILALKDDTELDSALTQIFCSDRTTVVTYGIRFYLEVFCNFLPKMTFWHKIYSVLDLSHEY